MTNEAVKILQEKRKVRSGKGSYSDFTPPTFGFGRRGGINYDAGDLISAAKEHYGEEKSGMLLNYFDFGAASEQEEVIEEGIEEMPIERGANWGAW